MSDQRDTPGRDPAERLAAALDRIAIGLERREAVLAARVQPAAPPEPAPELPVVAANLDALIARLRAVLGDDNRGGSE